LLPENAILAYTPSEWIEHGETCEPPQTSPGFVSGLNDWRFPPVVEGCAGATDVKSIDEGYSPMLYRDYMP